MANSDKMTRDIMERVKRSVGVVPRYASGTARLFLASGAEFFKNEMPAPVAMVQTNQELLSDAVRFLRNPVDAINKQVDRALGSDDFKALQRFAKNALDDLKTGNLYDPVRDRSELGMQIDADLASFGGVDLGNFDENGDWMEGMDSSDDDNITVEIAKIQDRNDSKRTSATIDAIGASTNAIVNTENANTQMSLRMSIKQHSQQMQALENMITAQTSTFELINKSVQASMNVTREAHNQMIGKLDEMTGLLQKIAEGVSPKPERKDYKEQEDIFGYNGELNIKQYIKRVAQNIDDKYAVKSMMSNLTMGMGIKGLLELVQDNPWTLISSQIIQRLVPEKVQKQMQRTNRNFESFMPALLQKLGERGRAFDEGRSDKFSDLIAGMFGVTPRSRASIDTAYENPVKQAAFTSKTARAIEEVIPMWLARIDSHISGGPLMVYNYKTGKLENAGRVVSTYEHSTRDLVGRMGESASEIMDRAGMYKFSNSDEQKKFLDFVYRYLQKQGEENRFINPYQSAADFKQTMPDTDSRDLYYNLLTGILTTMPRDKIMQASRDILNARQSRDKNTYTTNNDLKDSGLIAAWSGFMDQALQSRITSESVKTRSGLTDIDIDNISKELHDKVIAQGGVQATNVLLADIVRTLRGGIITYSYNIGKRANIEKLPDYVKTRAKIVDDASIAQHTANANMAKQRNRVQDTHASVIAAQEERTKRERAQMLSDEDKLFVNLNTTAFDAAAFQAAINYSADSREDPDNPAVVRRRQALMNEVEKLNGARDKVMQKTGINGALQFLRTAAEEPFRLFSEGLRLTDAFMFKMLFGEDAASNLELNGEPYLLQTLTHSLNAHFKNAVDWFASNVGNPMKHYLLDEKTGLLPRIGASLKETFGWDDKKSKIKSAAGRLKDRIVGTREVGPDGKPIGEYKGGRLSSTLNKFNSFGNTIEERITGGLDHMLYGDYGNEKRSGVKRVQNRDANGRFISGSHNEYGGAIGKLRQGFDSVQDFLFGDDDSREKWNKVKGEVNAALPDMIINGGIGMVASLFLPGGPILGGIIGSSIGLVKGSNSLSKFLFGEFSETEEEDALDFSGKKIIDRKTGKTKKRKVQTAQGLISREVYDGFKQYAPKMTIGAMIGAAAGGLGLLPFGMGSMAGTAIGSIGGMLGASDAVKNMIFGDGVDPDSGLISKNFKDKIKDQVKKYAPSTIVGALSGAGAWAAVEGLGLIPGLSLIPGGPIFSMLGGLVGMSNADKFNQFLFGEEVEVEEDVKDKDGNVTGKKRRKKREGGAFGKMFDFAKEKLVTPLAKRVDSIGKSIGTWFHKDVLGPLDRAIDPLKQSLIEAGGKIKNSLLSIGDKITTGILSAFNINISGSLGDFFKEKVIPRFEQATNKFFSAIGKVIGNIIAAPFKALEYIVTGTVQGSDSLDRDDARKARRKERDEKRAAKRSERRSRNVTKNANNTGRNIRNLFQRVGNFFGFGSDSDSNESIAPNQVRDSSGRVRGRANSVSTPNVIQLGPGGPTVITSTDDSGKTTATPVSESTSSDKTTSVTDSERRRKNKDTETDAELNQKRTKFGKGRSNNSYLGEIAAHTRSIDSEIKGQLGGTGWNIAYIKTLLEMQFGSLSDDQLPEEMEGSKKVKKKRGFFGKMFGAAGDWISDKKDKLFSGLGKIGGGLKTVGKGVGGIFQLIFHPIKFLGSMLTLLGNGIGKIASGLWDAAKLICEGIVGALKTAGKLIQGAAKGVGESLGNALSFVTGSIKDIGLAFTATARGIVEFVADSMPDVGRLVIKGIGALGSGLFKGAKMIGSGIGKAGQWAFNKLTGRSKTSATEKIKNIGTFQVSGGYLDKVNETVIKVGDPLAPVDFPILSIIRGKPMSEVTRAIPVYVVGSGSGNDTRSKDKKFKRAYQKADRAAEHSSNPAEAYDKAVDSAETAEEIQAIALANQMNANSPVIDASGNGGEKKSFLDTIMSLFGSGLSGLVAKVGAALGGTAVGAKVLTTFSGAKAVAGAAGSTALSAAPGVIGAVNAASKGDIGHAASYGARGIFSGLRSIIKAGSSNAPKILQKANLAVSSAVTSAPGKLVSFIKKAASKVLSNKTIASFLTKLKIDPTKIISSFSGHLDDIVKTLSKESAEQLLKKANLVIMVATAVYDFTSGMYNAKQYFAVDSGDTTLGMRVASGLAKAISGIAFGLIPVSWLASIFYNLCASAEAKEELKENQEAYKAKVDTYNAANGTQFTAAEYAKKFNDDGTEKKGLLNRIGSGIKSIGSKIAGFFTSGNSNETTNGGTAYGTGRMTKFSQVSGKWNRGSRDIATAGCGPTAAAMVATSYGRNANPVEANNASYATGMRAADGGTNPAFFKQYAASKGYGMEQGPTSSGMIQSNLSKGRPVVLMGRGGDFGSNTHYLVADRNLGKGRVSIVDPLTGGSKAASLGNLMQNTSNTIYSYGKGPGDTGASADTAANNTNAQNALVNAMSKIQGKLSYSLDGDKQNPDKGVASCASTVGWAYRKVIGGDFATNPMSASSTTQATDSRFKTIWVNDGTTALNTSNLKPGDVMYFNWGQTKYNGKMKHTEMYAGNNQDWSHGGNPAYGPTLKDLNDYRRKHLMMVRRYSPFVDGKTVTYSDGDIAAMNLGGTTTSNAFDSSQGDTLFDRITSTISGVSDKYTNFISRIFGAKDETGEDGTSDTESANADGIKSSTDMSTITGTSTGSKIWNYLIGKGLTKNQTAGIMGNLYAESGLSSNNLQNSFEKKFGLSDAAYTAAVNSGSYKNFSADKAGYGLAQWTSSGRKAGLLASAKNSSKNIDDLGLQLDYLWNELNGSYKNSVLNPITKTNSIRDATKIFMQKFEVPQDYDKEWKVDERTNYANTMYSTYGTGPRMKDLSPLPQFTSWGMGGGDSTNLSSMNDRIRRINRMITKTREEASKTETATQITSAITDAVDKATSSDQSMTQVLQVLTSSLSTMIQLLSDIKTNTTPKDDDGDMDTSGNTSNIPTVRADHFDSDSGVGTNTNDIGARIIDNLTSK